MNFLIKTEKGSSIEFDSDKIQSVVIELDGVPYEISIIEQKHGNL